MFESPICLNHQYDLVTRYDLGTNMSGTFPTNATFEAEEGVQTLRRVMIACVAWMHVAMWGCGRGMDARRHGGGVGVSVRVSVCVHGSVCCSFAIRHPEIGYCQGKPLLLICNMNN